MNCTINFGKTEFKFSLKRKKRKTLAIHVYPDQSIEVVAPEEASMEKVKQKILKRAPWIIRKQIEFSRIQPPLPKPLFIAGETFRYLGKQYRLKIIPKEYFNIALEGKYINVYLTKPYQPEELKKNILKWYRTQAKYVFTERILSVYQKTKNIGIEKLPEWSLHVMKKRWGSCTKAGKILLHPELVAAPTECIDYVITHEFCHIIEHNHSVKFYTILSKVLPEWEELKNRLNENVEVRLM